MDDSIYDLIWSDKTYDLSPEAVVVYLMLRCDIRLNKTATAKLMKKQRYLVSGLDVHTIARKTGYAEATVRRMLEDLRKAGWVSMYDKSTFQLGSVDTEFNVTWFAEVDKPKPEAESSAVSKIRAMLRERAKRKKAKQPKQPKGSLSFETKRSLVAKAGLIPRQRTASSELRNLFLRCYKVKFGESFPIDVGDGSDRARRVGHQKTYAMLSRFLTYCDESQIQASSIIVFFFENWEKLSVTMHLVGRPTMNLLGTALIVSRLKDYVRTGIPEPKSAVKEDTSGLATRADDKAFDKSKDAGWK